MARGLPRSERGQAVVETILVTWIVIAFIAMALQVFLANESIYRSMTAVHQQLFKQAFERNQGEGCGGDFCSQERIRVEWAQSRFPEVRVPVLPLFQTFGAPSELVLRRSGGGNKETFVLAGTDP